MDDITVTTYNGNWKNNTTQTTNDISQRNIIAWIQNKIDYSDNLERLNFSRQMFNVHICNDNSIIITSIGFFNNTNDEKMYKNYLFL